MEEQKRTNKRIILLVAVVVLACMTAGAIGTFREMTRPVNDTSCDMINAWALAWAADRLEDDTAKTALRKRCRKIKYLNLTDFSSGVIPYIGICRALSLPMDEEKILECLRTWYVPEQKLFTFMSCWVYDGTIPDVESNLGATLMLLREYPEILRRDEEFHLREGILSAVQNSAFLFPEDGKTEHQSGGLYVWLIGLLSGIDNKDYTWALPENILDWYSAWEQYAESGSENMNNTRWEVSKALHQPTAPAADEAQRLFDSWDAGKAATLDNTGLLITLRQLWPMLDTATNPAFLNALKLRVEEMAQDFSFDKFA